MGIFLILVVVGIIYLRTVSKRIYDEDAQVSAPEIDLTASQSGKLEQVFAKEGEVVPANFIVARVGNELIKTKEAGLIIGVNDTIGHIFNPGETIVAMIRPEDLRVVARVDEGKGLDQIKVGQLVIFTVDAFGSKQYRGVVDEVSPTSRESALSFSISQKRPVKEFNVKIRFNFQEYPELKNGMSAKVWIYK